MSDAVNKPAHYNQGPIECIDAMKIVLTPEEYRGYLKGNAFKYLWREKDKNGNEDIRKGKSYYDRLIELIDESEQQKASDLQSLKDYPFGKLKTAPLNSDKIPEGYRKLNDSSEEPRQLGDLRWSVAEKRYVEISGDEIGYANRDNWPACRKIEPAIKQSSTTEPPDGWRWLEVGEVMRNGDTDRSMEPIPKDWIGSVCRHKNNVRRRNKFEVGGKVVEFINNRIGVVKDIEAIGKGIASGKAFLYHVEMQDTKGMILFSPHQLAPYIEETT